MVRKAATPVEKAKAKAEPPMTVVLRDIPPGFNWGWYSREDQRMHLQTQHQDEYKVWLEKDGKRIFEPVGSIPSAILKKLKAEVVKRRTPVEAEWVHLMIEQEWLTIGVHGTIVNVTAYPRTAGRIEKSIDLVDYLGESWAAKVKPEDVFLIASSRSSPCFPSNRNRGSRSFRFPKYCGRIDRRPPRSRLGVSLHG